MKCPKCNGEQYQLPEIRGSSEVYVCLSCNSELFVRSNYQLPESSRSKHSIFSGSFNPGVCRFPLKSYLKLKSILSKYESFSAKDLESQFVQKHVIWKLGFFLDFEVAAISLECERQDISVDFVLLADAQECKRELPGEMQEFTKQEFKDFFLKFGKVSDGWGVDYWHQIFEKDDTRELRYLVRLPSNSSENRMMVTTDYSINEVRLFFVADEQEEHLFRS